MLPKRKNVCDCGVLESASKEPDSSIRWDEKMNEYHIVDQKGGQLMVYYCPFCGGKTPDSRRSSLFAHVTDREQSRIYNLFWGVRTEADVIARFGPADEELEFASAVRIPGRRSKPEQGRMFRGLVYKNLSPVADIIFEVGVGNSITGTWRQKYLGDKGKG